MKILGDIGDEREKEINITLELKQLKGYKTNKYNYTSKYNKRMVLCDCGKYINYGNLARHKKTYSHSNLIK